MSDRSKYNLENKGTYSWRNVELTPLCFVPGKVIDSYQGRINLHFIKESFSIKSPSAVGHFFHQYLTEANAIARDHVASVGGNALLNYRLYTHESGGKVSKNEIYSMLSIAGDAVKLVKSTMGEGVQ